MKALAYAAGALAAVLALSAAPPARAEVQQGAVDWQKRTIKCKGQAAPDQNASNVAAARIGAERAAKLDAMRNILETVKGVQVSGGKTAADAMKDSGVSAKVQGLVRGFKVTDTRYFSDGGVEVDVEMPLDALTDALVPAEKGKQGQATPAASGASGLVVDARGLKLAPALAPRIVDEEGSEIYGPSEADREKARAGLAAYAKDVESAQKDARVGDKPVVVKAVALAMGTQTDVVLGKDDAKKAREAHLAEGNVVFVQ